MTHNLLALLLLAGGFAAVAATLPQLLKLIRLKDAREFSLVSWSAWMGYQLIALAYTIDIKTYIYAVVNSLWVVFYLCMVILIVKYRRSAKS